MIGVGDVFWFPDEPDAGGGHFYVLLSDPDVFQQLVLFCLTTWEDWKDDTCVIEPGEEPDRDFPHHTSAVDYARGILVTRNELQYLLEQGPVRKRSTFGAALLRRIAEGAQDSGAVSYRIQEVLEDQGLIEP